MTRLSMFILSAALCLSVSLVVLPAVAPDAHAAGLRELEARLAAESVSGGGVPASIRNAYEAIPYDQAQIKASHNSYDRDEKLVDQLARDARKTYQGGCRAVELDVRQDRARSGPDDVWRWSVQHDDAFSTDHPSLVEYLNQLRDWDRENPNHDVLTVHIELKDAFGDDKAFCLKFDQLLLEELAAGDATKFYRPADLMKRGRGRDLVSSALRAGFPTIGELRGKFIVVITGGQEHRRHIYGDSFRDHALAFVDANSGHAPEIPSRLSGNRVFFNVEIQRKWNRDHWPFSGRDDEEKWKKFTRFIAGKRGLITRGWKANDGGTWNAAVEGRINLIATDRIRNYSWATVGAEPFRRR